MMSDPKKSLLLLHASCSFVAQAYSGFPCFIITLTNLSSTNIMAKCPRTTANGFGEILVPKHQHLHLLRPPWPPLPSLSPSPSSDSNRGHTNAIISATAYATPDIDSLLSRAAGEEDINFTEEMNRHNESPSGNAGKNKNDSKQENSKAAKAKARAEARCNNTDQYQTQPEHEIHIWTERERRKKMRNMFSNLHSLLPHLPPKADKSTIVDEAISYIRSLQRSLQLLQTQKLDTDARAVASANLEFEPIVAGATIFNQNQHALMATKEQGVNLDCIGVEPWISQPTLCPVSASASAIERCHFQTWSSPNVVLSVCGEDAHISVICMPPKQGLLSTIFYILEKHKVDVVTAHISTHNCGSIYMIHAHVNCREYLELKPSSCEEAFKSAIGELMFYL